LCVFRAPLHRREDQRDRSAETNAHLLRYDSVHGRFPGDITVTDGKLDLGRGPMT
jgi:glyceraldehyde-3-phosphate dehydrogenase/erythrose-4-phosphate dehydrogenase